MNPQYVVIVASPENNFDPILYGPYDSFFEALEKMDKFSESALVSIKELHH